MNSQAEEAAAIAEAAAQRPTTELCRDLNALDRPHLDETGQATREALIAVLCERHPQADAALHEWATQEDAYFASTDIEAVTRAARAAADDITCASADEEATS